MAHPVRYVCPDQIYPARLRLYQRAIWIAVAGNGTLVLAKGAAAWLSGSAAVLVTATDSFTGLVYNLLMAWCLWLSQHAADESYSQRHGRIESVVCRAIALMMGLARSEVVKRAMDRLLGGAAAFCPKLASGHPDRQRPGQGDHVPSGSPPGAEGPQRSHHGFGPGQSGRRALGEHCGHRRTGRPLASPSGWPRRFCLDPSECGGHL